MENLFVMAEGAALMGLGIFGYLTVKKGVPWAWTTLKAWWTKGKADLASAKADIAGLQGKVASLETEVGQIKTKLPA